MFNRTLSLIKEFFFVTAPAEYKNEFTDGINKINVSRAKATCLMFIFLESMLIIVTSVIKRNNFLQNRHLYYMVMYLLLLIAMIMFLLIFIKLEKNIPVHRTGINILGTFFISFILCWCAGISLLDQMSSGQIIVYAFAIIAVAVTPVLKPYALLLIYLCVQTAFLILLPFFEASGKLPYTDAINSTTFIIVSWFISNMRYKKQIAQFNNEKKIQRINSELKLLNDELEEANRKLEKLSQTDGLTGISNRFMFDRTIESEWNRCKRLSLPLSLLMFDVDFFKAFNDNYGHPAGDDCLRKVAGVLKSCAKRSSDTVARYGGEEFVIILPNTGKEAASAIAEQIRKKVEELSILHNYSPVSKYVTVSVGINTAVPSSELSIVQFVKNTDKALYKAKIRRNSIVNA